MIIRRQTETRFVVAAAPVAAEAIQSARRPQRPAGDVGEAVDVVVYREQERAKKLLQYVCGVCVLLQQRSLVLRPQAASLRPPTAMEIGHACAAGLSWCWEKATNCMPPPAGQRRPFVCEHRPFTRNVQQLRLSMVSTEAAMCTEPAEVLKIRGRGSNLKGITCSPLLGIGLTDLPKSGGGKNAPFPQGSTGLDVKASEKESERAWPI